MSVRLLHEEDEMASLSFIFKLGPVQSIHNFEDKKLSAVHNGELKHTDCKDCNE